MSIHAAVLRDAGAAPDSSDSIYPEPDVERSTMVEEVAAAGAAPRRCGRRSLAGIAGLLLVAGTIAAAATISSRSPPALTVGHVSQDGLNATFSRDSTELVISTTNSSMAVSSGGGGGGIGGGGGGSFALGMSEKTLCRGRAADGSCAATSSVTTTTIMDRAFVSLRSATGKRVTVRKLSDDALLERDLGLMYDQSLEIEQRVRDAAADMEAAMRDVREQHQPELKAWVDAAWNLDKGALKINGMALPHVLPFVATGRDLAEAIDYQPVVVRPERLQDGGPGAVGGMDLEAAAANERRRQLDEFGGGFHGQWGDGSCQGEGLPTDEGASALRAAYYTQDCRGMCGPGCDCWSSVCGNCCWHQYCYDHDNCNDEVSFLSVVFRYSHEQCQMHFQC
jgi:hypothetical protein